MLGAGVLTSGVSFLPHRYWRVQSDEPLGYQGWESFFQISFFSSVDGSGTDLCIGKTASASTSYGGYPASLANDNNASTRWANAQTSTPRTWWGIDLGSGNTSEIHSVKMQGLVLGDFYFARKWYLQWSDDNTNWTTQSTIILTTTSAVQTVGNL